MGYIIGGMGVYVHGYTWYLYTLVVYFFIVYKHASLHTGLYKIIQIG